MARRTSAVARILDRYVGIPAIVALSILPKNEAPGCTEIERVGVLKTAAIGDTLLLASMLGALKRQFPRAQIVLITGQNNAPAAQLLDHVIDRHEIVSVSSPLAAIKKLRTLRLDILLECGPWPRYDALITVLSGAGYRVGFRVSGQARHFAFDRYVDHSRDDHQMVNFQRLAKSVGAKDFDEELLPVPDLLGPDRLPRTAFVVFHPYSGGYMGHVKEWPVNRWVELGRLMHAAYGVDVLVSGGPEDVAAARDLALQMSGFGVKSASLAGEFTLPELADLLARSRAVVSVNTGVMHLASMLGVPTVSLEGPVPPERWGPIGPNVRSVVTTLPQCGYLDLGFEYGGQRLDCMQGVSVEAVARAVAEFLPRRSVKSSDSGDGPWA